MVETLVDDLIRSIHSEAMKEILSGLRDIRPALVFENRTSTELKRKLDSIVLTDLFSPVDIFDLARAKTVKSGLYLWNDCMEASHSLAQEVENPEGSYMHAIIHRREPDYANSGYWYARAGEHPVYELILDFAREKTDKSGYSELGSKKNWNWRLFNKLCRESVEAGQTGDPVLTEIQLAELVFLLTHSYRHAIAK